MFSIQGHGFIIRPDYTEYTELLIHGNRKENNTDHGGRLLGWGEEPAMWSRKWVHISYNIQKF